MEKYEKTVFFLFHTVILPVKEDDVNMNINIFYPDFITII